MSVNSSHADALLQSAILGTSRTVPPEPSDDDPVDGLFTQQQQSELTRESQLLLRIGAQAVYQAAAQTLPTIPELSPPPATAQVNWPPILISCLKYALEAPRPAVLLELLQALREKAVSLPEALLPQLLSQTDPTIRAELYPLCGDFARWLSQFQPDWHWLHEFADGLTPSSSASTLMITKSPTTAGDSSLWQASWNHGSFEERLQALRCMRAEAPDAGRGWVEAVWSQEKADQRVQLLNAFAIGLAASDQAWLKQCLNDRSKLVRRTAAELLARLPASALSGRFRQRAAEILVEKTELGRASQTTRRTWESHLPQQLPGDWQDDGIPLKSPDWRGNRDFWLEEVIARVPLDFWETHFATTPLELINGVLADERAHPLLTGWTRALLTFPLPAPQSSEWRDSLTKYWTAMLQHAEPVVRDQALAFFTQLAALFAPSQRERLLSTILQNQSDPTQLPIVNCLGWLGPHWSRSFSADFLRLTKQLISERRDKAVLQWLESLDIAAGALSLDLLSAATENWSLREEHLHSWQYEQTALRLSRFQQLLKVRSRFHSELNAWQNTKSDT